MKKIFLLLALLALVSCRSTKPTSSGVSKSVVEERSKDTLMFTQPDSASLVALIRCDSLGNAYLAEIARLKTGRSVRPSLRVKNNLAYFDCKVDSMAVYLSLYKRFEKVSDTTSAIVTVYQDRKKGRLEKFMDGAILIGIGAVIGFLVLLLLFKKKWA
ncbi:MAG: hypothetical protein IPF68_11540 [Bacteroidales bacterium]|nr:hypothetical protein [Bacteroidales bacterium]